LPSRRSGLAVFFVLVGKECRELVAARAWWILLVVMGPLVGVAFISAMRTYAEASGLNGTAAGVGEAFSPLVGIWAPTFSACELAAAFLLPFVAIRLVSGDRLSGALKLELQRPMSAFARVSAKAVVLLAGWIVASLPTVAAILLWRYYGGHLSGAELSTVVFGHVLNGALTIALAAAASTLTSHPSTAAILTLAVTVGTWIVNFVAAVQGGWWERAAGYTPTVMVAQFQHGLVRLDVVLIALVLILSGLGVSAIWMRSGVAVGTRVTELLAVGVLATISVLACATVRLTWDTSEGRRNSFSRVDEAALRHITSPLSIVAHLAPEDPRRADLEHRALSRLRRALPALDVRYVSATSIGLFEQTADHYGEVWYELDGRREMSRVTTAEAVLDTIYALARIAPPREEERDVFRGYPLAVAPAGAAAVFYGIWPVAVATSAFFFYRR
jgi:ABC-2 type transport system permease protein